MTYFVWTSDLNTGIEVIDSQHRQIVDYINQIHDAIDRNDEGLVLIVLDRLTEYTISHFTFEENLMELAKYPLFPDHKLIHVNFAKRVRQYHDQVNRTGDIMTTARQVMTDLQVWLISHIKREDANYVKDVKKVINQGWISRMVAKIFKKSSLPPVPPPVQPNPSARGSSPVPVVGRDLSSIKEGLLAIIREALGPDGDELGMKIEFCTSVEELQIWSERACSMIENRWGSKRAAAVRGMMRQLVGV